MSSTIKPKFEMQLQRQVSQATAERKSELSSNHLKELKNLGQAIKQRQMDNREVANAAHAVNHIKSRSVDSENSEDEVVAPRSDSSRLYTRQAKLEDLDESDVTPSEVESAQDRLARHKDEKLQTQQSNELAQVGDDFYHVKDRGNTLTEDARGYYIDAYAPEHEKAGVRVSITHNKAVISGSRKADNQEQSAKGKMVTNNFQTFREEFNFSAPVASAGMTREREGDYIRFFIPKLSSEGPSES
ncbi:MAG: hypothetical protein H7235_12360 [Bdellovibrionaceae bacterium]|nr:hypothetical protein [Pseudobdellovibrionaceae bacterium]